jgi:hypothetical protein
VNTKLIFTQTWPTSREPALSHDLELLNINKQKHFFAHQQSFIGTEVYIAEERIKISIISVYGSSIRN